MIVVSSDPDLFSQVRSVLGSDPRFIDTGETVHCNGSMAPLTNIYPVEAHPGDWDDWNATGGEMPDPRSSTLLILETRSPEWVAEVGRLLARALLNPLFIVDSEDTVWPADQVDPKRLALA